MMERIVGFSLANRGLVLIAALTLALAGGWAVRRLPLDAVPDVTNVQVQINTEVPGTAPVEVEQLVTVPIETSLSGLPDVDEVRSLSKYGLSQVTVVFKDHVSIFFARQLVGERLQAVRDELPRQLGLNPLMGPVSTGLGEIFQYTLKRDPKVPPAAMIRAVQQQVPGYDPGRPNDPATLASAELMALRSVQDWIVRRQLLRVPGVAEVNAFGGHVRQYQVWLDPRRLLAFDLTVTDVLQALERNNANAGGAVIEKNGDYALVRGVGLVRNVRDLEQIVLKSAHGTPLRVQDVGAVVFDGEVRMGATTRDGEGEQVAGIVMMLKDANARDVVGALKEHLPKLQKSLPDGVSIEPYYDRQELVDRTVRTALWNLFEGGLLVIVVLYLTLGRLRGSLIIAAVIPLSMLVAILLMVETRISGNLMSLGALDFGILIDGGVVMVENALRLLQRWPGRDPVETVRESSLEVARPVGFGMLIILIVYLPVLTLQGMEGKLFRPLAYTVSFALLGALLASLTVIPVLASWLLRPGHARVEHSEDPASEDTTLMRWLRRLYRPSLNAALARPVPVLIAAAGLLAASGWAFTRLGSVFIPKLDEGSLALQIVKLPSTSLAQSVAVDLVAEKLMKQIPEVRSVVGRAGRAEIAVDPAGPEITDTFVALIPPEQWRPGMTKERIRAEIEQRLNKLPGINVAYGQPIELRVNELVSGVRSDVAVKVFGPDFDELDRLTTQIAGLLKKVRGTADLQVEQTEGLPQLNIEVNREALSRHGLNVEDVHSLIQIGLGGAPAGEVLEGDARYQIVARLQPSDRGDPERIGNLLLRSSTGERVPLREVATLKLAEGPAQISREEASRRKVVELNVRGRDIGSFVAEGQRAIDQSVKLPPGYSISWGGQFENLQRARERLLLVVPMALALIFALLFMSFGSVRHALLIFTNVPFAVSGGIFALAARGLPFSISAGVGFIVLAGIAVLNGVVMTAYFNTLRASGRPLPEVLRQGADVRLRPILMTALCDMVGFVPMAFSHSAGAEVQRPLATVVIGGLVTCTLLTLFVLPILYRLFEARAGEERL